jgi:nucleoid-associated protein YejK
MSTYKDKLNEMIEDLQQENIQFKELLKECRKQLYEYSDVCLQEGYEIEREEVLKLLTKIINVMGEKAVRYILSENLENEYSLEELCDYVASVCGKKVYSLDECIEELNKKDIKVYTIE